jgi:DNA segregation ATPase FtsK/SpoIIIE-like protein
MISVAIGKEAERVVTLDLSAKSSMAHCVITGMTGSGKSSLLHDMILGIAETYSPSEVEFWLLDFKTGAEFTPYVALKHVK